MTPTHEAWPELKVADWEPTRDTLHMWLQIVGKIQMVSSSLVNHWWNVSFEISGRGLRTRLMRAPNVDFDAEFDFVDHQLVFRTTTGGQGVVQLKPRTVADFWAETQQVLASLGVQPTILPSPNEVSPAVPFDQDTEHKSYDADAAHRFWRQLLASERAFSAWRAGFIGKDSPVQVFWGSLDLSVTRFSGRNAPPHTNHPPSCPPWVMQEAESRENAAAGFWPGGSGEGVYYAYVYPEPDGYRDAKLTHGHYDTDLGEYVLPYTDVRQSDKPDDMLLLFLQETYEVAARLGKWDRAELEVDPHRLDSEIYQRRDLGWPLQHPRT